MSDCATALQPRGRVHYFINESDGPMEMLWVYAGPKPERIVVEERCATVEGNPWRCIHTNPTRKRGSPSLTRRVSVRP